MIMMMIPLLLQALIITSSVSAQKNVSSGCFDFLNIEFILIERTNESSYDQARQACTNFNSDATLAVVDSSEKFSNASSFITDNEEFIRTDPDSEVNNFHIGLQKDVQVSDRTDPVGFVWDDGTRIVEGDFGSVKANFPWSGANAQEPNDSGGAEECVEMRGNGLLFNDRVCLDFELVNLGILCQLNCGFNENEDENEDENDKNEERDVVGYILLSFGSCFGGILLFLVFSEIKQWRKLREIKRELDAPDTHKDLKYKRIT